MTQFDKIYATLVNDILTKGIESTGNVRTKYIDGTPAHYKQLIGYNFRLDNSGDEAHLLTSRFIPTKSPIRELYWIWILQSNDVQTLRDLGCKFWNEWELPDGTIGEAYGAQISTPIFNFKSQLDYIVHEIKNNPNSRRIITEIWVPSDLDKMALTPCVHLTQWSVIDNKLYLEVRQRSCDVALGLVANVFQYSVLHKLIAITCGLEPADIIWNIHNVHIYDRHIEDISKQVLQYDVNLNPTIKIENCNNVFDFKPDNLIVENYNNNLPKINYEIAI